VRRLTWILTQYAYCLAHDLIHCIRWCVVYVATASST
jgi:hypothetical protein